MENGNRSQSEFQLLKLKVASEIVRSSQAVVAFSRAFYLEEVLIDKIGMEIKELKEELFNLQTKIRDLLIAAHLEDNIATETNLRLLCSTIQTELDTCAINGATDGIEEFERRDFKAEARRQAKSSLLQQLSSNSEIMLRFESLSLEELREVQVPEFSCFINESDFGQLEELNGDWGQFRKELGALIKSSLARFHNFFTVDDLNSSRNLMEDRRVFGSQNRRTTITSERDLMNLAGSNGKEDEKEVKLDEIGKTFANRSGNVLRKFSSLLRRGNRKSKHFSEDSFEESGDPVFK